MTTAVLPPGFRREISREELLRLPIRKYQGEIVFAAAGHRIEHALADYGTERVAGFDIETRPSFRKGESHLPALAQVATARAVYLLALRLPECRDAVARLLAAPSIVKVGVSVAEDLRQLRRVVAFEAKSVLDAGLVARRHGLRQTGLRNLAAIFLGIRIPKGGRTSNWGAAKLSPAQITYAATDAWVCRELFLCFERLGLLEPQVPLR